MRTLTSKWFLFSGLATLVVAGFAVAASRTEPAGNPPIATEASTAMNCCPAGDCCPGGPCCTDEACCATGDDCATACKTTDKAGCPEGACELPADKPVPTDDQSAGCCPTGACCPAGPCCGGASA